MNKPNNFCVLPWIHLETSANGFARPCCIYSGHYKNSDNSNVSMQENNITQAMNSYGARMIRKAFENNEKPDGCKLCWDIESAGGTSKRIESNKKYSDKFDYTIKPIYLDLKFGTTCNLKCRICSPWSSSKWLKDQKILDEDPDNPVLKIKHTYPKKDWSEQNNNFWNDFMNIVGMVEHFDFTGGEPMMIEKHKEVLRHCVEKGYSKYQTIHYNTNGTHYDKEFAENVLSKFKFVDVMFSIDGIKGQFEYQRHPAKWEEVNNNIHLWQSHGFYTHVCCTVNVQNALYLDDMIYYCRDNNLPIYLNIMQAPEHFNIKSLPLHMKKEVDKMLNNVKVENKQIKQIINFMYSENWWEDKDYTRGNIKYFITKNDELRNEKFVTHFSEAAEYLEI
tara:strand:- start:396 stop:1568 length:1173 start_codon:yes stop_codon:yes gene_type:complete